MENVQFDEPAASVTGRQKVGFTETLMKWSGLATKRQAETAMIIFSLICLSIVAYLWYSALPQPSPDEKGLISNNQNYEN
jgi:hypothetical protein